METVNTEEAKKIIDSGDTVLIDFYAPWCGPCKRLGPILEEMEKEVPDVAFLKVNIDEDMDFAQELGVSSVPTMVIFKGGTEVNRANGLLPKDTLNQFVKSN